MSADSTDAERLFFAGTRALDAGNVSVAGEYLLNAIALQPDFAEAHANLALVLEKQSQPAEAEASYRKSISLDPGIARTHLNLGALLATQRQFGAAEAAYHQAILLEPRQAAAWSNLGVLHACLKQESEAEQCYRTAMALDADYALAPFNLSYLLLRQGRYEEGWRCFEARDWYRALSQRIRFPRWQGEPVAGKSLMISCEAGYGDMIQFGRYAALLKQRGARLISMICQPALTRLFADLDGVDQVIPSDKPIPQTGFDYWTPLLSIPYYCETRLTSIPAALPYIHVPQQRQEHWARQLDPHVLRVGLVWKGNPKFENDAERSLPSLEFLAPLAAVDDIQFVSLQKGAGEDEAIHPPVALPLLHLGSAVADFADSAAIIANLDLVITVDTAVAHLAGALAKPCWLLLPHYKTDWRWLVDRVDSPWYPGVMRLFRQNQSGRWEQPIRNVAAALQQFQRGANQRNAAVKPPV